MMNISHVLFFLAGEFMERNITTDQEKQNTGIRILSSNALKVIACICMLIDHVGLVLMYNKWYMRAVGRLSLIHI